MVITPTNYTIADYCTAMERNEIKVNREYQRSDKVWPPAAKSFLIESILLNFPIPKLSLYQITDVKSRRTIKEIVDGQQRSQTILEFFKDKFRLSKSLELGEAQGKLYSQLEPEYQQQFLDYALSVDLIVSTTPDQIREIFRRINSYTIPLNPEESRNALFQGEFKWFIYKLSNEYDQILIDLGVFREKQIIRMSDTKLFAEIIHALLYGITQTGPKALDKLYKEHDHEFLMNRDLEHDISNAINYLLKQLPEIHKGPLMKPYNFYSLILALCHLNNPNNNLQGDYELTGKVKIEREYAITNLTTLSEDLENQDIETSKYKEFILASLTKTNAAKQRKTRFIWLCRALGNKIV